MEIKSSTESAIAERKKRKRIYFLSFLLPVCSLLIIFAVKGIYPFGTRSFLRTDMYHQYAPFFAQFAEKLQNGGSLLYSWEVGLGSNFLTLFAYYLSSPFQLFLVFLSKAGVIDFMTYLIVFKTGLAGLTMSVYLCRRFEHPRFISLFFAMAYALSGYMAAYSWNIMWLDCIWLAPLVFSGLWDLVEKKKGLLYCITLALSIFTNYYISIMLCLFLVLYFICLVIQHPSLSSCEAAESETSGTHWKEYVGMCLRFAGYSLLAGGLAAVLLVPVAYALKTTASASSKFPSSLTSYFTMIDMLARHMAFVDVEIGLDNWPNIYSCAGVFLLFPLYVMNKKIPFQQKIVNCVLLFVMLVSFAWNIPNYIWHGFHFPNSLPCRQSFLYTFLLLSMCYEGLDQLEHISVSQIVSTICGGLAFIFLCEKLVDAEEFSFYTFYINAALVAVYGLFLYLYRRKKASLSGLFILTTVVIFAEMTLNMGITSITTTSRSQYLKGTEKFQALSETAEELADGDFFRIEKASRKTKNDGAWSGYSSASLFSSTTNAGITSIYKKLGMEGSTNAYSFNGATPFTAALLSVRYIISSDLDANEPLQKLVATSGEYGLYENLYTLPLGFMIPTAAAVSWNYTDSNPLTVQDSFVASTTMVSSMYTKVDSGQSTLYTFTATTDGYYYGVLNSFSVSTITATYSDSSTTTFSNVDRDYVLDLGYLTTGEQVSITGNDSKQVDVDIYRLKEDAFEEAITTLQETPLVISSYTDTEILGHISADKDGILFTSIPYEDGWSVYVDGVQVETTAFADAFLTITLSAGEHDIRMEYTPVGLWKGAMISLVSLTILLVILFWKVHKNNVSRRKINLDEERKKRFPKPDRQSPEDTASIREIQKTQEAHKTQLSDKTPEAKKTQGTDKTPEAEKTPGTDKTHETT